MSINAALNTPQTRDEQILARQFAVMQRQILDLMTALARAEAVNQQLVAEHEQMHAEIAALHD